MDYIEQLPKTGEYLLCLVGNKQSLKQTHVPANAEIHVFAERGEMPVFLPYTAKKHILPVHPSGEVLRVVLDDFSRGLYANGKMLFLRATTSLYESLVTSQKEDLESEYVLL